MEIIKCDNLNKAYRNKRAVKDMSVLIQENKITGVIGRNGAGKTTLLKMIAGFYQKTSGQLQVFGEEPFNNLNVSANMIFIDDNMSFPKALTLSEILESAATFYPLWDQRLAKGLFDYFSLDANQYHDELSKGMKSTFNMIIGIAARCRLTIFDEPTTGMDAAVRKDFYRALLKDYIEHPRTILLSSHLLQEIEDILEDVLLIKAGQKLLHLPVVAIKELAIGLRGNEQVVQEIIQDIEVYHKESFGVNSIYVVIENRLTEAKIQAARDSGVEITAISTNDICVYLTSKHKGGIDDVFNRA
jgi:ABC-2 type transport system ATP-binding protein